MQEEIPNPSPNFLINQTNTNDFIVPTRGVVDELPRPPATSRRTWDSLHFPSLYFFLSFTFYCGNVFRASTFSILQEKRKKKKVHWSGNNIVLFLSLTKVWYTHTHTHIYIVKFLTFYVRYRCCTCSMNLKKKPEKEPTDLLFWSLLTVVKGLSKLC